MRIDNPTLQSWMIRTHSGPQMDEAARAFCDELSLEVQPTISAVDPSASMFVVGVEGGRPLIRVALPRQGVTVHAGNMQDRWALSVDSQRPVNLPIAEGRFQFSPTFGDFSVFRKCGLPIFDSYESDRLRFSFVLAERARFLSTLLMIAGR